LLGTCRLKVFLEFIWVPQTWPSWTAITRTQWPAAAREFAIVVIYVWIRMLFSSPLLTPPPSTQMGVFLTPNFWCGPIGYQFFFFNFLMDQGWQTSLGRFRQISPGWWHYFKKLLKLEPVDINVATPSQIIF
jgi:hypothetical protein